MQLASPRRSADALVERPGRVVVRAGGVMVGAVEGDVAQAGKTLGGEINGPLRLRDHRRPFERGGGSQTGESGEFAKAESRSDGCFGGGFVEPSQDGDLDVGGFRREARDGFGPAFSPGFFTERPRQAQVVRERRELIVRRRRVRALDVFAQRGQQAETAVLVERQPDLAQDCRGFGPLAGKDGIEVAMRDPAWQETEQGE